MNLFKYKYMAHKLVNYIFYIVVFVLGFVAGISIKNAKAATFELTEERIYEAFSNSYSNFDIKNAPKILCQTTSGSSTYSCYAFNDNYIDNMTTINDTYFVSFVLYPDNIPDVNNVYFYYVAIDNSSYGSAWYSIENGKLQRFPNMNVMRLSKFNSSTWYSYTNFDTTKYGLTSQQNKKNQVLDFSSYEPPLEFNENLFENDSNFKKLCVDGKQSFAITPTFKNDTGQYEDFIWFPYGLNNGLYRVQYDSKSEYFDGNVIIDTSNVMRENFYFSDKETIDSFYSTDLPSSLEQAGYTNKYSYYGYDAYKFFIVMKDDVKRFPIFTFDNPSKTYISSSGTTHGGGGFRLDDDNTIVKDEENYCFYLKNGYDVKYVSTDTAGDFIGTVNTPDGEYNFTTSYLKDKEFSENNFFNDFKDNDHGLSSIITIPLNTIKKISNGSCNPINVDILGANFELKCGDEVIWNREDVKNFKIFWNMFWGGIICYGIGLSLFKLVHKLKDPNSDKVEVIDL